MIYVQLPFGDATDLHLAKADQVNKYPVVMTTVEPMKRPAEFRSALIIVDLQNDFLSGGSLAVDRGFEVINPINALLRGNCWDVVVATQDWHPSDHISFARNHGQEPFTTIEVSFEGKRQEQMLWPVHCVQNSKGSELSEQLNTQKITNYVKKGYNSSVDSYSAFADSFGHEETTLPTILDQGRITHVYVVGLAEDYCVYETAIASAKYGRKTFIIKEAVRGIKSISDRQVDALSAAGVEYVDFDSEQIAWTGRAHDSIQS